MTADMAPALPHINTTRTQHDALAMAVVQRIWRYADADLEAGRPSVEHAEQILAAAAVYLKQAVSGGKDGECAARHAACNEDAARKGRRPAA